MSQFLRLTLYIWLLSDLLKFIFLFKEFKMQITIKIILNAHQHR